MTPTAADELARKITQTWPGGPKQAIWAEAIAELDAGTAGTAYVRLRREYDHCPSIARFHAECRALHTPSNVDKPECVWCDGTGWVEGPEREFPPSPTHPNGYTDSTVIPCPCKEYGDQARRLQPTILNANAGSQPAGTSRPPELMPAEAQQVAYRAYTAECRRQGREPNPEMFGALMDAFPEH